MKSDNDFGRLEPKSAEETPPLAVLVLARPEREDVVDVGDGVNVAKDSSPLSGVISAVGGKDLR